MTVAAQAGIVSVAKQSAKVGRSGTFDASALTWYKFRSPRNQIGLVQEQQVFPQETGGPLTPDGAYKQAYFFVGDIDLLPRLEDSFGVLLEGVMGTASGVADKDSDATTVAGLNTHIYRFDPADESIQPWLALRRLVPGSDKIGETGFDAKISQMRFTIPAKGKIAVKAMLTGRDVEFDNGAAWVYENSAFESTSSVPDAGRGEFKLNGVEYPLVGATIDLNNGLSTPDQEAIIGDFRPDDFIPLSRNATIRIMYKWDNPDLYEKVFANQVNGTTWSSLPFIEESDSDEFAFDCSFQSPGLVGATGQPYKLRFRANKITWAVDGPVELRAGGIITQSYVGTVLTPDTGDYLQVVTESDVAV